MFSDTELISGGYAACMLSLLGY